MKIRFKETPTIGVFGDVRKDIEYLVLGIDVNQYYILTENNEVGTDHKDLYIITEHSRPEFWVEENGQIVPEEWLWKNFFSLNDEPYLEWDEIWFITQFAKGLEKFNLPVFPSLFKKAYDKSYKEELIGSYLKIASDYDSSADRYGDSEYTFKNWKNGINLPYFRWEGSTPQHYEKILITSADKTGYDVVTDLLKQIGSPFEYHKFDINLDYLQVIRNRILFSLWSIWGTKEFQVFQLKYSSGGFKSDYLLKKNDDVYLLSFDYYT
ncbi:hypothetical protein ABIB62_000696 [Mucilaginibacter sp. UYP25]|uniref:hypothetical protein n=1 Tax=unclassified Mucilaginibacter TaxID=2617802 RepID=UPI00339665C9